MQKVKIWFIPGRKKTAVNLESEDLFQIHTATLSEMDLKKKNPESGTIHILVVRPEEKKESLVDLFKGAKQWHDVPKLLILPEGLLESDVARYSKIHKAFLIDDRIRDMNLHRLLEFLVQLEYYRFTVESLYSELVKHREVFENVLGLARRELMNSRQEGTAYRLLLDFEDTHKKFSHRLNEAMRQVDNLREHELLTMKQQLEAAEKLSGLRDRELMDARATVKASEAVIEYSRREKIEQAALIDALNKLRSYTERELLELIEENTELRKKLGLPTRRHG